MKRRIGLLIVGFITFFGFIPMILGLIVYLFNMGIGISNYYMDITVLNNGNLNIRELKYLNGSYHGVDDNYYFNKGSYNSSFKGTINDLKSSQIYNGDNIAINEVKTIKSSLYKSFNDINKQGNSLREISYVSGGYPSGVYFKEKTNNNLKIRIFNNTSDGFYTDYTINNIAVKHQDVSEVFTNLFNNYNETIKNLIIHINVPNNKDLLNIYLHGHRYNINIIDNNSAVIKVRNLKKTDSLDLRIVFDKDIINTTKITDYNVLSKINELESMNNYREYIDYVLIVKWILYIIYIGCLYLTFLDVKEDKREKCYKRDLPSDEYIGISDYILTGEISSNDFYATILLLIDKGYVSLEKINDDYKIKYVGKFDGLNKIESCVLGSLIYKENTMLSEVKAMAATPNSTFQNSYKNWAKLINTDENKRKYFNLDKYGNVKEGKGSYNNLLFPVISIFLSILLSNIYLFIISAVICLIVFVFYDEYGKYGLARTAIGEEATNQLVELKSYLEDFSRIEEKDLPDVKLWSKYLIYATSFGIASVVRERLDMDIKNNNISLPDDINVIYIFNGFIMTLPRLSTLSPVVGQGIDNVFGGISCESSSSGDHSGFSSGGGFSGGGGHTGGRF